MWHIVRAISSAHAQWRVSASCGRLATYRAVRPSTVRMSAGIAQYCTEASVAGCSIASYCNVKLGNVKLSLWSSTARFEGWPSIGF